MAKAKVVEDTRTQGQKFIDAAREVGADTDVEAFRRIVRQVATAPVRKAKKKPSKHRG